MTLRVLVTGGRDFKDRQKVFDVLDEVFGVCEAELLGVAGCIIHGGATGADLWADEWAIVNWKPIHSFPVTQQEWKTIGLKAGPLRNQRMLDEGKPDLVVSFPGGSGTADMVRRAKKAGIRVMEIT